MDTVTILLVEDSCSTLELWKVCFEISNKKGVEIVLLIATSVDEAREKFWLHQHIIKAVVFDGCIDGPGEEPNSKILVSEFRRVFKGPMIAASNREDYRKILTDSGCDYECDEKDKVPKKIFEIFG